MFEIFIALFGGLFYAGKYISDKSKTEAFKRESRLRETVFYSIKDRVTSKEDEQEVKELLYSGLHRDEIYRELRDDFKFICGSVDKASFPILDIKYDPVTTSLEPYTPYYWAYHLLLAHRGKVDRFVYSSGFPIGYFNKDKQLLFCQRIEKNLLDNGTGLKLYMQPGIQSNGYNLNPYGKYLVFEHQINASLPHEQLRLW